MKKLLLVSAFAIFSALQVCAQEDATDCKDSPMFNRMPNTFISECAHNFDLVDIPMGVDKKDQKEGTKTYIGYTYNYDSKVAPPSFYQIVKNHETAIAAKGGKRIYYSKEAGVATLFAKSGDKDVWIVLADYGGIGEGQYGLTILEMEPMKQDIQAGEMLAALNNNGSIALYINFETGKSDIKMESRTTLDQVAQMLTDNPTLKISVEGHTDNAGNATLNKTLSENRAKAVMNYLVAKGINTTRLTSKGWGQTKPIADNSTEEGKAKNRRVELVKM